MSKLSSAAIVGLATTVLIATSAQADERYNPVTDKTTITECGACHMVFQPQMLTADASLDNETVRHLINYHVEKSADSKWWGGKFMRGLSADSAPLRITETPYWVREHNEEVPQKAWSDPKVKSKANCLACHPRAVKGDYDDD